MFDTQGEIIMSYTHQANYTCLQMAQISLLMPAGQIDSKYTDPHFTDSHRVLTGVA